jgi:hypothetical protein
LFRIISGGQTGVDRAALDAAFELGLSCGGWCPKGRRAEDGRILEKYPLKETESDDYAVRTEWNVRDSDGTLIITRGKPTGGTAYTIAMCRVHNKPCLVIDLCHCEEGEARRSNLPNIIDNVGLPRPSGARNDRTVEAFHVWLTLHNIQTLNIAGPRESNQPGIYSAANKLLINSLGRI